MSRKRKPTTSPEPQLPYGTEPRGARGPLVLWIVLCAVWLLFMTFLALCDSLQP